MLWRTHPPSHISFESLAVATDRSAPSCLLVRNLVGLERHQLSLSRGEPTLQPLLRWCNDIHTTVIEKLLAHIPNIRKSEYKATSIVQAPVYLFSAILCTLAGGTGLWAVFARIPVRVNGIAILSPVDGLFPVVTPGSGSLVYPLLLKGESVVYSPPSWSARSYDFLRNPNSFSDEQVAKLAQDVLNDVWTFKTVRADLSDFSGGVGSGASKTIQLKEKDMIAFVTNTALDTKLTSLVSSIEEINRLNKQLTYLQKQSISQQHNVIEAKEAILAPLSELVRKGYSSKLEYINAQADLAAQKLTKSNTQGNLNTTQTEILNNQVRLRSELADYLRQSSIYAYDDSYIAELITPQWQEVASGQTIAVIGWGDENKPVTIPLFVNSRAASEVALGMPTVSTPIGFSVAEVGGIKGVISNSDILPLDVNVIASKLGSPGLAELVAPNGSAYEFNLKLQREEYVSLQKLDSLTGRSSARLKTSGLEIAVNSKDNRAGYIWNNKSNPPLSPRTGMLLATQITTRHLSPIQMLIPTLKEWTGLSMPKKLQDLFLNR